MNRPKLYFVFIFMWISLLMLGGCGGLLDPGAPPSVYQLSPELPAKESGQSLNLQLAVVKPSATEMLSTNRVVTRFANGEVKAWKGVSWSAPAPVMMQRFMIQAYEDIGLFTAMSYDTMGYNADYRLISDLREFTVVLDEANKPDYAVVLLSVHLIDLDGGRSLGSLSSKRQVKIEGPGFGGVLAAFNSATAGCVREICGWSVGLLKNISARHK